MRGESQRIGPCHWRRSIERLRAKWGSGLLGVGALAAEMREMRVAIVDGDRFEFIGVHRGARWKFCFDVFTKYFVDMPMSGRTSSLRL
jgi:hypothetical protein